MSFLMTFSTSVLVFPSFDVRSLSSSRFLLPLLPLHKSQSCPHHISHALTISVMSSPYQSCPHHISHVLTISVMSSPYQSCPHHISHVITISVMSSPYQSCHHHISLVSLFVALMFPTPALVLNDCPDHINPLYSNRPSQHSHRSSF